MNIILSIQKNKTCSLQFCIAKTALQRLLFIMITGVICLQAVSQVDQRIALGDKYFAAGEYYTAAILYEQFLNPSKKEIPKANFPLNSRRYNQGGTGGNVNKLDILHKQAESYRLANYWPEAAKKYTECFEKDPTKFSDALYWYAVCQRSLGKYDLAQEYINRFLQGEIQENNDRLDAEKELQTIQFIKKQLTRPDTVMYRIKKTTSVGSGKGTFAGTAINGNQFIFTSTATDSIITMGVNPYHSRLFYATLENGSLQNPEPVSIDGIDVSFNQGAACISADKNFLYFTQWKKENGKNMSSIYFAARDGRGWSKPVLLSSINKEGYCSKQPYCSADGKTLFFASNIRGGSGNFDIWSAPLQADGTTGIPVNAGTIINTAGEEQAPFYHSASGDLVFASNGRQSMGGFDLFMTKMNGSQWDIPENMGYPVNSSRDDIYFFAPEEKELLENAIIGSDRGSDCCLETYSIEKSPKRKMIAGIILDCGNNEPLADAQVIMKDATGKNFQITTGPDGKFSFDLAGDAKQNIFYISKEKYKEKAEEVAIESVNKSDWRMDILQNKPICIDTIEVKKLVIKVENVVTVYFDFDKSILKERGIEQLDSIYTVLAEDSAATIQISGYTDGLGSDAYNKKLSDRRAKACADYLISKGVATTRISFESFGKCCPVEMELINGRDNPDGRSRNRRALINISKE
jgi:outer membrane protein OmpA-like peptidoglycan-associated protein/tetratricopeptide (TPR) repeat protein